MAVSRLLCWALGHRWQLSGDFHPWGLARAAVQDDRPFPQISPHGLRRTYNDLLRRVADLLVVQAMTGHADNTMTAHYSLVDHGEKSAAAARVLAMVRPPVASESSDPDGAAVERDADTE